MSASARRLLRRSLAPLALAAIAAQSPAQSPLPAGMQARIDSAARDVITHIGAPSTTIAVVRDGKIAYANAYGSARVEPAMPATPAMRYSIGSVSKQFTATAILLLAERHKLSLDDKVGRWLPDLSRAQDVTIRQILSMTSGYQDYWPQDYVMPPMLKPVTPQQILNQWAKQPLDFEPGSKWQYSNTNYTIAGLIAEKAAGMPLVDFLRKEVFAPLHMESVFISDDGPLGPKDPERYVRYASGPLRIPAKEGKGWLFGAGELAMTASDLARWDISVIDQTVLKPASYHEQQTSALLTNGVSTGYGFGVAVGMPGGHRMIAHDGGVSGFTTQNRIYPDDHMAIVVITNLDATSASEQIARRIANVLFSGTDVATDKAVAQAKVIFAGLQHGTIDRALFTDNARAYFSDQVIKDFAAALAPLGTPTDFTQTSQQLRGGMVARTFRIRCAKKTLDLSTYTLPNGKLEQYLIESP